MSDPIRSFGIIGLGKMVAGLAENALAHGFAVVGLDARPVAAALVEKGVQPAKDLAHLAALLPPPRVVMLYVPAGPPVDHLLDQWAQVLSPGDIVADGGNSYWGDSIRRHARLKAKGLHFIDVGTSGGPGGTRDGACFMIGGDVHAGPPGAGHFVKLVHNGIEFGMLQAIGEGMGLLAHYRDPLPVDSILQC